MAVACFDPEIGFQSVLHAYLNSLYSVSAYARRLSEAGLFIATNMVVYPVGSRLVMDIDIGGTVYRATGLVRNALKIEARYARLAKPGMGFDEGFTMTRNEMERIRAVMLAKGGAR